jgi:hypothetical protein
MWKVLCFRKSGKVLQFEYNEHPHPELRCYDPDWKPKVDWGADAGNLELKPKTPPELRFKLDGRLGNTLFYEEI